MSPASDAVAPRTRSSSGNVNAPTRDPCTCEGLPRERGLVALREERLEVRAGRPRRGGGPRVRITSSLGGKKTSYLRSRRADGVVVVVIVVDVVIIERRAATGCSAATAAATATVAERQNACEREGPDEGSVCFGRGGDRGGQGEGDRGVRTSAV